MLIVLKVAIMIVAAVLTLPIEYVLFPKLDRQERKDSVEEKTEEIKKLERLQGTLILIMLIGISIVLSVSSLFMTEREIWYWYLIPMAWTIFWQFVFACTSLQKRLLPFVLPILAIALIGCIMLPIRDAIIVYEPEVSTTYRQVWEEPVLSEAQIKARLNASSISEPTYDRDKAKYIYEIKWKSGYGLAVVKGQNMEFIPCKYQNQTSGIVRENYPKEEIVKLGIQLQTENKKTIPYAKFGILKRPHIFSKPEIDFYVLLNMQSGKITKQSD